MAKQTINLGAIPDGSGGDTQRSAFTKTQANFDEIYTALGGTTIPSALPVAKGGTGGTTAATARTALGLKTAAIADIIGTVAAGAIFESGNNANGNYIKTQDGILIQWKGSTLTTFQNTSNLGYTWIYPVAFANVVSPTVTSTIETTFGTVKYFTGPMAYNVGISAAQLCILSPGNFVANDATQVYMGGFAIGRWK